MFKFKDSIPLYRRSNSFYKFQCNNCNINYYCKTELHHKVRAGEQISTSPLMGKRVNNNNKNLLLQITNLLSGHKCSFDDFIILNYEPHKNLKESLLVTKDKPLLNKQAKSLILELF